ncbi:MAG: DNA-binding NtrC family response regulator [Planctomycetota bacterium]|jgi:DNA-binding NtrC family response regulator
MSGASDHNILVVDDDADIRVALEMLLKYEGFSVWTAKSGTEALQRIELETAAGKSASLVISDVKMPGLDGIGLLDALVERPNSPPVVLVSGHADVPMAVEAVRKGALDFLEKPLDQNRVLVSVRSALRQGLLARENQTLKARLAERYPLIGSSPAMEELRVHITRAAGAMAPILVTGENGTGKEVVARNLHMASDRAAGPFIAVNCAAIPAELIESELFGHEKGSFTGAFETRVGHFEAANGGTLFLDEIGDMPLAAQAKVLRALETREITRVGSTQSFEVDIRVVAATNADLAAAVEQKAFRMDLFFRLNVVPLRVPPLRDHIADVDELSAHFLQDLAARSGRANIGLSDDAKKLLRTTSYPGNIRQLRNLLEGAMVFCEGDQLNAADLAIILEGGPALATPSSGGGSGNEVFDVETFEEFKNQSEALFFRRKLDGNAGNVKRTAEELGMQRSHLYRKLERYDLRR